jgi:hypothetical protein
MITRFEIEIEDKGRKEDPKIRSFYKFIYYVQQIEDKMKRKKNNGSNCKSNCKFTCQQIAK